jgi:hypothetical protein
MAQVVEPLPSKYQALSTISISKNSPKHNNNNKKNMCLHLELTFESSKGNYENHGSLF